MAVDNAATRKPSEAPPRGLAPETGGRGLPVPLTPPGVPVVCTPSCVSSCPGRRLARSPLNAGHALAAALPVLSPLSKSGQQHLGLHQPRGPESGADLLRQILSKNQAVWAVPGSMIRAEARCRRRLRLSAETLDNVALDG